MHIDATGKIRLQDADGSVLNNGVTIEIDGLIA